MKVKLEISPDADVAIEADADGNPISITFTPLFASPTAQAVLAYGTVTSDKGKSLDQFSLIASGNTGKIIKKSRSKAVIAVADSDEVTSESAPKDHENEEEQ